MPDVDVIVTPEPPTPEPTDNLRDALLMEMRRMIDELKEEMESLRSADREQDNERWLQVDKHLELIERVDEIEARVNGTYAMLAELADEWDAEQAEVETTDTADTVIEPGIKTDVETPPMVTPPDEESSYTKGLWL